MSFTRESESAICSARACSSAAEEIETDATEIICTDVVPSARPCVSISIGSKSSPSTRALSVAVADAWTGSPVALPLADSRDVSTSTSPETDASVELSDLTVVPTPTPTDVEAETLSVETSRADKSPREIKYFFFIVIILTDNNRHLLEQ